MCQGRLKTRPVSPAEGGQFSPGAHSHEKKNLTESEMKSASAELRGLFELFEDDDALYLFEMAEPADAAVAHHDPVKDKQGLWISG